RVQLVLVDAAGRALRLALPGEALACGLAPDVAERLLIAALRVVPQAFADPFQFRHGDVIHRRRPPRRSPLPDHSAGRYAPPAAPPPPPRRPVVRPWSRLVLLPPRAPTCRFASPSRRLPPPAAPALRGGRRPGRVRHVR